MNKTRILFIHHSTGALLLQFGNVRSLLKRHSPNTELWDHGYNLSSPIIFSYLFGRISFKTGLSDGNGHMTGKDFNLKVGNDSPKAYDELFSRNPKDTSLAQILDFDIIAFKNCFPTTKIETPEKLQEFQSYYRSIFAHLQIFSNKFIVFTPPPLRLECTNPLWAQNARILCNWLLSQQCRNITVFDFFDLLADGKGSNRNMLKRQYCNPIPFDSHPNIRANKEVGKKFVDCVCNVSAPHR